MKFNLSPPCLIFYRPDLGLRDGQIMYGEAKGPFVWIREDVKDDKGILAHELEHARQFWAWGLIIHMLLLWIPRYRAWSERKAYTKQMQAGG
jgi:hypothetical protein